MDTQKIMENFASFISIPSVSASPKHASDMKQAVQFLQHRLQQLEFEVRLLQNGNAPPMVYARRAGEPGSQSIGIYGHYDVQPEDPVQEWDSHPFELTREKGNLYGRGTADNKGHIIQNIAAIESLIHSQSLKNTIIFLIEGEEETGSEHFASYIEELKDELVNVDVFFITDVEMYKKNIPMIIYALRGLIYFEIQLQVGAHDMHSGVYGNAVLNPAQILADLFAHMKDVNSGEVKIPRFYDDVRTISPKEMSLLRSQVFSDADFQKDAGSFGLTTMRNVPPYLSPKIFPSLDIHGISSGFVGAGPKTIIPAKGRAKFSCRLVEHQDARDMDLLIRKYIDSYLKKYGQRTHYSITSHSYDNPFYCSIDDPYLHKTARILSKHFGNETVLMREGGSIPAAEIIQRVLGKPVVLTGFILPDANLHAPNEHFDEDMFWEGIEVFKKIYVSM